MTAYCLHFSPCGSTQSYACLIAGTIDQNFVEVDLTKTETVPMELTSNDIVIAASPVYGGRIPGVFVKRLSQWVANGAKAISLVVYGNRAYDDALLELNDVLSKSGFVIAGSAAVVARHVFNDTVAEERPDSNDFLEASQFAEKIKEKLQSGQFPPLLVPGNRPYREFAPSKQTPFSENGCLKCSYCALNCPTGAVSATDPNDTDPNLCILCMRCVVNCPGGYRTLPKAVQEGLYSRLAPLAQKHCENEFFL